RPRRGAAGRSARQVPRFRSRSRKKAWSSPVTFRLAERLCEYESRIIGYANGYHTGIARGGGPFHEPSARQPALRAAPARDGGGAAGAVCRPVWPGAVRHGRPGRQRRLLPYEDGLADAPARPDAALHLAADDDPQL